jgi:transposase InsO family protein
MSEFSKNAGVELTGDPGTPVSPAVETDHEAVTECSLKPPRRRSPGSAVRGERPALTPQQRLFILDSWRRSGLPGAEFGPLVGLSSQTLYGWKQRFARLGPAGLSEQRPRRPQGSRLPEPTQRAVLMLKELHPEWGVDRLHDVLVRSEGFPASAGAILRLLKENGYQVESSPSRARGEETVKRFERARPNELWQSDLFTFVLKPSPRRAYLVVYLDDHSRFVVGYGLHASGSGALVREAFEAAVANFGPPVEVLTDHGPQYASWRGKSAFTKLLEKRGVKHLLARPRRPQTLGKTERFWGTLWRECLETAVFRTLEDARTRVGHFIDYYNFQRPHQGIESHVPADRFFSAAPEVRKTLEERVARNAAQLARDGAPRKTFYLTGRVGDEGIALHGEDGKVILTREGGGREEVDLEATGGRAHPGEPAALPPPSLAGPSGQPGEEPDDTTSAEESRTEEEVTESPATGEER